MSARVVLLAQEILSTLPTAIAECGVEREFWRPRSGVGGVWSAPRFNELRPNSPNLVKLVAASPALKMPEIT